MKKSNILLFTAFILSLNSGCGGKKTIYTAAPNMLPNTQFEMNLPGYWINRNPDAYKVIMNEQEIEEFNALIDEKLKLKINMRKIAPYFSKIKAFEDMSNNFKILSKKELYSKDNGKIGSGYFNKLKKNMNMNDLFYDGIYVYGLVFDFAELRFLPSADRLYSDPAQPEIDELQNSGLDVGTPLAVMHETIDKKWYYVTSSYSKGWVDANKVIICDSKGMKDYINKTPFVVVTSAKAELFADSDCKEYFSFVRMGARLPIHSKSRPGVLKVLIPFQSGGELTFGMVYVKEEDINEGYLPYTPANIIRQAFKLLNAPYGWNGLNGEQSSSGFIQHVFATVGIDLPGNALSQAAVGRTIEAFDVKLSDDKKIDAIEKKAAGGITLLSMDGHIMLYLGTVDKRPYVIHEIWSYDRSTLKTNYINLIKRAVVSDLSLGEKSKKGSWPERIFSAREIIK